MFASLPAKSCNVRLLNKYFQVPDSTDTYICTCVYLFTKSKWRETHLVQLTFWSLRLDISQPNVLAKNDMNTAAQMIANFIWFILSLNLGGPAGRSQVELHVPVSIPVLLTLHTAQQITQFCFRIFLHFVVVLCTVSMFPYYTYCHHSM